MRVAVKLLCDSGVLSAPAWLIRTCLMTRLLAIGRQVKTLSSYFSVLLTCSFVHLSHLLIICSSWEETLANVDGIAGMEHIMGSFFGLNAEPTTLTFVCQDSLLVLRAEWAVLALLMENNFEL